MKMIARALNYIRENHAKSLFLMTLHNSICAVLLRNHAPFYATAFIIVWPTIVVLAYVIYVTRDQ